MLNNHMWFVVLAGIMGAAFNPLGSLIPVTPAPIHNIERCPSVRSMRSQIGFSLDAETVGFIHECGKTAMMGHPQIRFAAN